MIKSYDVELLVFILNKYKKFLYDGKIKNFLKINGYNSCHIITKYNWKKKGVHPRVWKIVEKDLIILKLKGLISDYQLEDLNNEFKVINK